MERRRMALFLAPLCLISLLSVSVFASEPVFYESFDESFEGRWVVSEKDDYKGVWKHAKSEGHEDHGLLVSEKARKYAIVKELPEPIDPKDGSLVLQYEVRLQNGLECGGAYLKYLQPYEVGWKATDFDNEASYSIMFGPDKCGPTNKVHFIYRHKSPKTGNYIEHHLKYPPSTPSDKLSHVYTAILKSDNELRILIDGEEKKKVNLLSDDFEPALIPPKTIPDPEDKKPEDWDERAKIPDPDAKKPEDWDEDAPYEIEDLDAKKPEGWLDDEPEEIDDPEATKPEDWDDEEDGEWEAPKISNPKCDEAPGCGEWKRPMKSNPDYKGKWYPPLIDNPNYKGIWTPQQIPNPDFFELEKPNLEPIAAIGIEIWTMQDGILFDNLVITRDEKLAEEYREKTWRAKFNIEKEKEKEEDQEDSIPGELTGLQKRVFNVLYSIADVPFLAGYKARILDLIEKSEKKPNWTIGILVSILVVLFTLIFKLLFGGKRPSDAAPKDNKEAGESEKDVATEKVKEVADGVDDKEKPEDENEKEDGGSNARQRRSRRET